MPKRLHASFYSDNKDWYNKGEGSEHMKKQIAEDDKNFMSVYDRVAELEARLKDKDIIIDRLNKRLDDMRKALEKK